MNSNAICTLDPISSTDSIYFGCKDEEPDGIHFIKDEETGYIVGFTVSSVVKTSAADERVLDVYPILVHKDYETNPEQFEDKTFTVGFVDALTDENITLTSDADLDVYLQENKAIVLLYNETTAIELPGESSYSLNIVNLTMNFVGDDGSVTNILDSILMDKEYGYYDFNFVYDNDYINVNLVEDRLVVRATKYFEKELDVKIQIVPKYAGELKTIEKIIKIKCDLAPTSLKIMMNGEECDTSQNINLYDTYGTSGDGLGTVFTFNCLEEYAHADLRETHILVAPEVFNAIEDKTEGEHFVKG
ncbi:MAG: hypothetical protein MJ149_01760, partial [Clostridia bacterium]|nr:hypothetical protein [Clostridia bacterium]